MSFEWLRMRIQEEEQRRQRESDTLDRLPRAMDELHGVLKECVAAYAQSFGAEAVEIQLFPGRMQIAVRQQQDGKWQAAAKVEVVTAPELPGFRVERGEHSLAIEVGILSNDHIFYRDCELDKYLTLEDLTRRVLDRALFPKLEE